VAGGRPRAEDEDFPILAGRGIENLKRRVAILGGLPDDYFRKKLK